MLYENILKTKTVAVWGLGYLGYTTILALQEKGFDVMVYDVYPNHMKLFLRGGYPGRERAASWSLSESLPKLDFTRLKAAACPEELFKASPLHIIASPEMHKNITKKSVVSQLGELFARHIKRCPAAPLIVFEPAFIPGHIEKNFVSVLDKNRLRCPRDYYLGALLRPDWNVEAFISRKDKMVVAGYNVESLKAVRALAGYFGFETIELNGLTEAEVYINGLNGFQAMSNDFVRQLALGYPLVNMKKISKLLFDNIKLSDCDLNMGTGGARFTFAVNDLIAGSSNPAKLTLLKELQDVNVTSVLDYADYLIRHAYKSVAILGLTYKGNQKDLIFSPSVTMADYLVKNSVKVMLNDPALHKDEIKKLVKGAHALDFSDALFSADALLLASAHDEYKRMPQAMLKRISKKPKLVIDNYGTWSHLSFGKDTKYHMVGDGTMDISR